MAKCVGCGYCCKKAACFTAEKMGLAIDHKCQALRWDGERYRCGLYQDYPRMKDNLTIGAGCSSSLNSDRWPYLERGEGK